MSKLSVYIDGDRSLFKSKAGIEKFKTFVKENETFNLLELSTKYLDENNIFELVNKTDIEIRFKIIKKEIIKDNRHQLKQKLNEMKNKRTNSNYSRPKSSVDAELYKEYDKANKMSKGNMPDISDILKNPDKYKDVLKMMLNNPIMDKLGKNHPLTKCYKLLGEKIGISNDPIALDNNENTESEEDVPTLVTSTNDEDTEEED